MGQTLFDPPNVGGWPGGKMNALWLNSGTWMTRLNYIDFLLASRAGASDGSTPLVDLQSVVNTHQLSSPEQFVDHFSSFLLAGNLVSGRGTQLLGYFSAQDVGARSKPVSRTNG